MHIHRRIAVTCSILVLLGVTSLAGLGWYAISRLCGEIDTGPRIRPYKTERDHSELLFGIALSPDGQFAVTTGIQNEYTKVMVNGEQQTKTTMTGTLGLWQMKDWTLLYEQTLDFPADAIFAPDGQTIVLVKGSTVQFREVSDGKLLREMNIREAQWGMAMAPDGKVMATGSHTGVVRVWNVADGKFLRELNGHSDEVYGLAFSPNGQLLASASYDHDVILWNVKSGERMHVLEGHTFWAHRVAFSPDGSTLASGSHDGTVRLWRVTDGKLMHTLKLGAVRDLVFSPSGELIAAGGAYDWGRLWRTSDGELIANLANEENSYGTGGSMQELIFTSDGKEVWGTTSEPSLRKWRVP